MHDTYSRFLALTALAASVTLGGCKAKGSRASADTTSAMTAMSHDSSAMGGTAGGAVAASLSDANIVALVDEVNVGDSTLAAAALPKLTNSGARNFARLMMGEHHGLHAKGLQIEKDHKLTPALPATDPFIDAVKAEQSALSPMSKGAAFDSTYIAHEIGIHQAVIDWQGKNVPQNAALQDYMKNAKAVYQRHLNVGHDLLPKLSRGQS